MLQGFDANEICGNNQSTIAKNKKSPVGKMPLPYRYQLSAAEMSFL